MMKSRETKAKLNIFISLICQIVTMATGIIIPKVMLSCFGSEVYGATTSISQFLSYIALLEGGIGGVARSVLYKPLADRDNEKISAIVCELQSFFKVVGFVFLIYVTILSVSFKAISHIQALDWVSTVFLVLVISISTFAQYFIGISYVVLLQADQKLYITYIVNMITIIINAILVVLFSNFGMGIVFVKLLSSCIFAARPIMLYMYVRRNYVLTKTKCDEKLLKDKWTGLGQHIAFYVHTNTDIAILTFFTNLEVVAVYSVYYMIVNSIQSIVTSFSNGMEAVFGNMYAKNEIHELKQTFRLYDTMISIVSTVFFSTTASLILSFIGLYTAGVSDTNYFRPGFSILLIISAYIFCIRTPYHSMIIAAGRFKQTKWASYGEAIVNLSISILLVINFGLIGVAIGTVFAVTFRYIFYMIYLSKHILRLKLWDYIKRITFNVMSFLCLLFINNYLVNKWIIRSFGAWLIIAAVVFSVATIAVILINMIGYKKDVCSILSRMRLVKLRKQ